eukprot:Rhum_TRINITY_DN14288_c22_g1::Rhum_TRINITY_DN14288_c22_g1_i1::g.74097::m.74097
MWARYQKAALVVACLVMSCGVRAYEDHGLVVFWAKDGIHEIEMASANLETRIILTQDRGDDPNRLWPPAIGGLCTDPVSQMVAWTENRPEAGNNHRAIYATHIDGSMKDKPPVKLLELGTDEGDIVYGCAIDPIRKKLFFVDFDKSKHRQSVIYTKYTGAPGEWKAVGATSLPNGFAVQESHPQGGGLALVNGVPYMSAARKRQGGIFVPGIYKLENDQWSGVDSCDTYGAWKGHLGYPVSNTDGSMFINDGDDSTKPSESRATEILKVPIDQTSPLEKTSKVKIPLSNHVGDDSSPGETNVIALSPTISSTSSPEGVLFLQGRPPNNIYTAELKGATKRPNFKSIYKADPIELGEYGIGPIVWTEKHLNITTEPETQEPMAEETPAPDMETPAPNMTTPAPPASNDTTPAPGNDTTPAPDAAVETPKPADDATPEPAKVGDTPVPPAETPAPDPAKPVATPEPEDPSSPLYQYLDSPMYEDEVQRHKIEEAQRAAAGGDGSSESGLTDLELALILTSAVLLCLLMFVAGYWFGWRKKDQGKVQPNELEYMRYEANPSQASPPLLPASPPLAFVGGDAGSTGRSSPDQPPAYAPIGGSGTDSARMRWLNSSRHALESPTASDSKPFFSVKGDDAAVDWHASRVGRVQTERLPDTMQDSFRQGSPSPLARTGGRSDVIMKDKGVFIPSEELSSGRGGGTRSVSSMRRPGARNTLPGSFSGSPSRAGSFSSPSMSPVKTSELNI